MCTHGQSGTHMHTDPQAYCKEGGGGGGGQNKGILIFGLHFKAFPLYITVSR